MQIIKKPDLGIFDKRFPFQLKSAEIYDPTKFTILTGTDGVLDDLFSYQVYNWIKNKDWHSRGRVHIKSKAKDNILLRIGGQGEDKGLIVETEDGSCKITKNGRKVYEELRNALSSIL